ncbi:DUF1996 domain-containing protein [Streptomyces sp. bgisy154]|uniref:DUF1996 domain-containing protein n=1 Tax=Streptomyces sp. bgisy154 TaxID=3413794 RepID=UPI003D721AA1
MRQNRRRRPTGGRRATFAAVALILGGGTLMGVNVYASAGEEQPGGEGGGDQVSNGPVAADYADITTAPAAPPAVAPGENASRGSFTTSCGVNEEGLFNSDNIIVAPGVANGAHHVHDYVGNQANNAFSSDEDLARADTSCVDQGDRSSYYWPVLRLRNGTREQDADAPGGGTEGNVGEIVTPKDVTLTFVGNPRGEVTAMPRLLRIITGDAKAFLGGPANANASWSCTGYEDRQLRDKYPLCPPGSDVVRSFRFQSCWDGRNIDSANHRTHVAFTAADGSCPDGFRAIPQLVQRIVYDVDAPSLDDGGRTTPLFAVDSFPDQRHKPITDHGDFVNVFDERLMAEAVACINEGRHCGAGSGAQDGSETEPGGEPGAEAGSGEDAEAGSGAGTGQDGAAGADDGAGAGQGDGAEQGDGAGQGEEPAGTPSPSDAATGAPAATDTPDATDAPQPKDVTEPKDAPRTAGAGHGTATAGGGEAPDAAERPRAEKPQVDGAPAAPSAPRTSAPPEASSPAAPPVRSRAAASSQPADPEADTGTEANASTPSAPPATTPADSAADAGGAPADSGTQAVQGGLAATGARLWPAAAGGVLIAVGAVMLLRRTGRRDA